MGEIRERPIQIRPREKDHEEMPLARCTTPPSRWEAPTFAALSSGFTAKENEDGTQS